MAEATTRSDTPQPGTPRPGTPEPAPQEESESSSDDENEKSQKSNEFDSQFPDTEIKIDYSSSGKTVEFTATRGGSTQDTDLLERVHFVDKKPDNKSADRPKKPGLCSTLIMNINSYYLSKSNVMFTALNTIIILDVLPCSD